MNIWANAGGWPVPPIVLPGCLVAEILYFRGSYVLSWVHMIQHLFLLVIIAPLLVASAPLLPLWHGLPDRVRLH